MFERNLRIFTILSVQVSQNLVLKKLTTVFAYNLHENTNFWRIKEQHYHVIAALHQVEKAYKKISSKPYSILCLCTCFRLLFHKTQSVEITLYGKNFEKLEQAVLYNHQHQLDLYSSKKLSFYKALDL